MKAVVECFTGQPRPAGIKYRGGPGRVNDTQISLPQFDELDGFKNASVAIPLTRVLENVQSVQRRQNLPISTTLITSKGCPINLDVEMETGTGKTYCYIKTMFELHQQYGWSKFIVVVPSIAIREGVKKSFEITAEHFLEEYGKRARVFIYNSKSLHEIESFSSDAGINVMIINVQAFNTTGKDARRIYEELDDFQSRKPIDVIQANHPILILDEPQKMEGKKTVDSLATFNPLMILRYSATHKTENNKIYRLDALDAYNQKLVKKIAVRGITAKGLTGTHAYLYVGGIQISATKPPMAQIELEIRQATGVKRAYRNLSRNDNLFELSGELEQYQGFVISDIDATTNTVSFSNGIELQGGEATGDVNETALRRIQIREAIRAHLEKEQVLFRQGIKVLTLFFIDEVAKYRQYDENGEKAGEYAQMFEEEYQSQLQNVLSMFDDDYHRYLEGIPVGKTHNGYFSIDTKTSRLVDPEFKKTGDMKGETDDVDAYDLILKDKERLLSFDEPTRFIFSHSALREGWDNPNVFVICTLKHSDNTVSRRQEVGRGMRLSVNRHGIRMDDPASVHETNVLTVVASESYKDFVNALQRDISESLSARPRFATKEFFSGKILRTPTGDISVNPQRADQLYRYLAENDYTDESNRITRAYHEAKKTETLAALPQELAPYAEQVFQLIDSVFSDAQVVDIEDDRRLKSHSLSSNPHKKELQDIQSRIDRKPVDSAHFDTKELVEKCIRVIDRDLKVAQLHYTVYRGEQKDLASYDEIKQEDGFELRETHTAAEKRSLHSAVEYDLVGAISAGTQLTRRTIATILQGISQPVFGQFCVNPDDFISKATNLIEKQKATTLVDLRVGSSPDIFTPVLRRA